MVTISALGKGVSLSRSALLYYDRLGLLKPSGGAAQAMSIFSGGGRAVEEICLYRQIGIPLKEMKKLLDKSRPNMSVEILQRRLRVLAVK